MTWEAVPLAKIACVDAVQVAPGGAGRGATYVGLEHISAGGVLDESLLASDAGLKSAKNRFTDRHILYGKLRPNLGKVARPRTVGICSTDIYPLLPGPAVDRGYLAHFLLSPQAVRYASSRTSGVNLPRVSWSALGELPIPLPPLSEQRRIAAILDEADALRLRMRRKNSALSALAFERGRESFDSLPLTGVVSDYGTVQLGRQRAPKYQTGEFATPYLRVANVHENRLALDDVLEMDFPTADRVTYGLRYGDILLNEGQSTELVGRPAMWREEVPGMCFQNTLVRFRADPAKCLPEYALMVFLHWLHRGDFQRVSSKTSNIAHLGAARFAGMPFPHASLEDQRALTSVFSEAQTLSALESGRLEYLNSLFASLQHRAFRGEL